MAPENPNTGRIPSKAIRFWLGVLIKAIVLFTLCNLAYLFSNPGPLLGHISAYNILFPGRQRLPYGDDPSLSYNLSLFNLEAMFASHEISAGQKPDDEFRLILLGDSSTWGFLLRPEETLAAKINALELEASDGRRIRAYNLGYPVMSLSKDLLIISYARRYEPDLVIWLFTLESYPANKQLFPPLLQHNPGPMRALINDFDLDLNPNDPNFISPNPWERTLVGDRRNLADLVRLQAYGVLWAATGVDQYIPESYTPLTVDLPADDSFYDFSPPELAPEDLSLDTLSAAHSMLTDTPVLLVNEPMFISNGENSDVRYNFYFPRWAYDSYREILRDIVAQERWAYLDLWNTVPSSEFTNTAVHLSPRGAEILAEHLQSAILQMSALTK
jgi:hypothetical protein